MSKAEEPEKPKVTLPGTVEKIIPANPIAPEKAQIAVEGADHLYREIRVDNTLEDEKGKKVGLKPGRARRCENRSGQGSDYPQEVVFLRDFVICVSARIGMLSRKKDT